MVKMGFVAEGMMVDMVPTNEKLRRRREKIDLTTKKVNLHQYLNVGY